MRTIKSTFNIILVLIGSVLLFSGIVSTTMFLFPIKNLDISITVEEAVRLQEYISKILVLFTVPAFLSGLICMLSLLTVLNKTKQHGL